MMKLLTIFICFFISLVRKSDGGGFFFVSSFVVCGDGPLGKQHAKTTSWTNQRQRVEPTLLLEARSIEDEHGDVSIETTTQKQPQTENLHTCRYCSKSFPTRNSLFRHIRTDPVCSSLLLLDDEDGDVSIEYNKQSLAIFFGYSNKLKTQIDTNADTNTVLSTGEAAYSILQEATLLALQEVTQEYFNITSTQQESRLSSRQKASLISSTQSSIARMRHHSLGQEVDCAAAGDVFVASLLAPKSMTTELWTNVVNRIKERIKPKEDDMMIIATKILDKKLQQKLHAERSCTQRIYRYLLPVSWLPDGDAIQEWWKTGKSYVQHNGKFINKVELAPEGLRKFKMMLRKAESNKLSLKELQRLVSLSSKDGNNTFRRRVANSRFGTYRMNEYRPWHNFADPSLLGDASPNLDIVWKAVDRIRIVGFVALPSQTELNDDCNKIVAVVEFKGDDFLKQQVRRIIGSAVAMSHGWLPENYFEKTTSVQTMVETPLAPPGRLYNAGNRFHFEERRTHGLSIFESDEAGTIITENSNGINWTQHLLMETLSNPTSSKQEEKWLEELHTTVCPRIQKQLLSEDDLEMPQVSRSTSAREAYNQVLKQLRHIKNSGRWPITSSARSTVIRKVKYADGGVKNNGSFTITNPMLNNTNEFAETNANRLFPELAREIFKLEEVLSRERRDHFSSKALQANILTARVASSHCAVNCNAEFTPHVDSGIGSGQDLSMIVGLGNYVGGDLSVEGHTFDILYRPIEFDGWKLRHWTSPFQGERFSLVWFTPAAQPIPPNQCHTEPRK